MRSLANEIVAQGEDRRGTYEARGWPRRVHTWWATQTNRSTTRENFCHYWRVVFIWAPLLRLRLGLKRLASFALVWVLAVAIVVGALVFAGVVYRDVAAVAILGLAYAVWGLVVGILVATMLAGSNGSSKDEREPWWMWLAILIGLPAAPIGFIAYFAGKVLSSYGARRFYRWCVDARLIRGRISPLHAAWLLVYGGGIAACLLVGWLTSALLLVIIPVAIWLIRFAVSRLGESIERNRANRRLAVEISNKAQAITRLEPLFKTLYSTIRPTRSDNDDKYHQWQQRLIKHVESRKGFDVWQGDPSSVYYAFIDAMPDLRSSAADNSLYACMRRMEGEQRELAAVQSAQREVARIAAKNRPLRMFFVGVGDATVLAAQYIRVKKWKICPVMEFPDESLTTNN